MEYVDGFCGDIGRPLVRLHQRSCTIGVPHKGATHTALMWITWMDVFKGDLLLFSEGQHCHYQRAKGNHH